MCELLSSSVIPTDNNVPIIISSWAGDGDSHIVNINASRFLFRQAQLVFRCNEMNGSYLVMFYSTMIIAMIVTRLDACDVMGSRACGQKPEKEDRESDPIKYCVASRVYFECVHKKYRGCENKEKYEMAMESIMKGMSPFRDRSTVLHAWDQPRLSG